jgi:nucleotide-binding universal stress UspA family protein
MFKQILVAYDGSESAGKAFAYGLDLAEKYGAELRVLSVARPPDFGAEVETEAVLEYSRNHYRQAMVPLEQNATAKGILAHFEVATGHPAEQIVYHAERHGADLIVVGHQGKALFGHWLIGSIAKQVMIHAPCSVLVAR